MRMEWLNKNGSDRVILFFNGWSMDAAAVKHLKTEADLLMLYDYRKMDDVSLPGLETFREVFVVGWSMGVWAANRILSRMSIGKSVNIALNGTERPVDARYGIPPKIYCLTEQGMNEQGREIFMRRMLGNRRETERFRENRSSRSLEDICEELSSIRKQCVGEVYPLKWDRVYISEGDVIFTVENQLNWWKGKTAIHLLAGGHYPFYNFQNWEEIIGYGNNQ